MSNWISKIGFRYLKSRKKTGFVSVIAGFSFLGIMLGVATLIIVMSVMNGFRAELMGRILGFNGHLSVQPSWGPVLTLDEKLLADLRGVYNVQSVAPLLEGQVMVSTNLHSQGALIRGLRAQDFKERPLLFDEFKGNWADFENGEGLIVGSRLAAKMGARIGDKITLISPNGNVTAFGTMPRTKAYTVVGTFNSGMYEYDSNMVFMPLEMAQKFLMQEGKISQIDLFVGDVNQVPFIMQDVMNVLPLNVSVVDWRHSNAAFFNAVEVERNVMFLILTLIIIVAAFNIISGLIMLVKDKTRDIAILRTMGASRRGIMAVFLIDGCFVGVVGSLLGLALGLAISLNIETIRQWLGSLAGRDLFSAEIYFLSQLPSKTYASDVILVVCLALGLSFLATLYPSWRASKTDPVEALRYE
ncbi:MAG: lipoprotein-releasing ABC transporter permease subunit [Alphaproteobacteria bacterium]|nr:lipoprotein-releasing ABC transporter permease subunit [Alphaproteobacteria bacterium]